MTAKHVIIVCKQFIEMSFKPICRLFSQKVKNSLLGISHDMRRQFHSNDHWFTHSKIQRVVSMLSEYDLTENQSQTIVDTIGRYIVEESELNDQVMRDTIDCWKSSLKAPLLRPNQLDKVNAEDIDFDMSVDFNHVVSQIEPKLLLMNTNAIEYRIDCLKKIGILSGSRDLWRIFVYSPNGFYLQSWSDFLKKYHYLNYRVLEWLIDKKDRNRLYPHPIVRNARVMEMAFESIQCRFLFALRTGLKTISVNNKLSDIQDVNRIDLKALLLTPLHTYLKLIAPNCSPEEYMALESLLSDSPPEEDEQIIEDLVELSANQTVNLKKSRNKRDENLDINFQIITQN